jgi:hypothetical protein
MANSTGFGFSATERIEPLLLQMKEVVDATPTHMREYPLMQRIRAQAMLKQVRLLVDKRLIDEADDLLIECEALLDGLHADHPNVKDLQSVSAKAATLRNEIDAADG